MDTGRSCAGVFRGDYGHSGFTSLRLNENVKRPVSKKLIIGLTAAVFGMFGFGYALVPLYDLFCEITGIGGKPTIASAYDVAQIGEFEHDRDVWVEFTGNSTNGLPWSIKPKVSKVKVKVGEINEVKYVVTNTSDRNLIGQAIPSVAPMGAARHLVKLECFCFDNQPLQAGEVREMPVVFYIHPDLTKDMSTLTLSYSFF